MPIDLGIQPARYKNDKLTVIVIEPVVEISWEWSGDDLKKHCTDTPLIVGWYVHVIRTMRMRTMQRGEFKILHVQ